jgi:hypothetical protein
MKIAESIEYVASFFGPSMTLHCINVFNQLEGVVIFLLFVVWNEKIWKTMIGKVSNANSTLSQRRDTVTKLMKTDLLQFTLKHLIGLSR